MNQKYKASTLLYSGSGQEHFTKNITVPPEEHKKLVDIRQRVRRALKEGFQKLRSQKIEHEQYVHFLNEGFTAEQFNTVVQLTPKFWTQGSFAYQTLNSPAQTPPQQIDIDDGVYFPMTFVEDKPVAAKVLLFRIVDEILLDVAKVNGWALNTKKATCSRLIIDEGVHMDIPIYAIPAQKTQHLEKAAARGVALESYDSLAFTESVSLDPNEVYLAMRNDEHWIQSDPKKVKDWFEGECQMHGSMLRRVCRYLKAWRDHAWKDGGPSSICLMVAAAETFDKEFFSNRPSGGKIFEYDCQALLAVVRALPAQLSEDVKNPAEDGEIIFPRGQSTEERSYIVSQAIELRNLIENALCNATTESEVVRLFREALGMRFPNAPERVVEFTKADEIRQIAPVTNRTKPETPKKQRSA